MIQIDLPYPTSLNRAYRSVPNRGVLLSADGRAYKAAAMAEAISQYQAAPLEGRLAVHMRVWHPDARRRDLDNLWKLPLDALSGIVYVDDSQFVDKRITLHGIERPSGRALLRITEIDDSSDSCSH